MEKKETGDILGVFASNSQLIKKMEDAGNQIRSLPEAIVERVELSVREKSWLENITEFDWIFFEDVLAVDNFVELLTEIGIEPFDLDLVRVCSFGEVVADRLRFSALHTDLIPDSLAVDAIIKAFLLFEGGSDLAG